MKAKLKQFKYKGRIEFFAGNGFESEDLYRISLRSASAAFLLASIKPLTRQTCYKPTFGG
jgi:hypothetical protein